MNTTLKFYLNTLTLIAGVVAFGFNLIPYGMIIGIPVYLVNLTFMGARYNHFGQTDRKIIIWLPLAPIGGWFLFSLLATIL